MEMKEERNAVQEAVETAGEENFELNAGELEQVAGGSEERTYSWYCWSCGWESGPTAEYREFCPDCGRELDDLDD